MKMRWLSNPLYLVADLFTKLVLLNFLWAVFTLLGLIVFGIAPATVALYTQLRRITWKQDESVHLYSLMSSFFRTWKAEVVRANLFAAGFYSLLLIWGINLMIMPVTEGGLQLAMMVSNSLFGAVLLLLLLFWFPVYVHFDLKWSDALKVTAMIPFRNLWATALTVTAVAGFITVLYLFPPLISFVGISGLAWLVMIASKKSFLPVQPVH